MIRLEQTIRKMLLTNGYDYVIKCVGFKNLLKIVYNDNIYEFYNDNNFKPYVLTDTSLTIDNNFVQFLNLKNTVFGQKELGHFRWYRSGMNYDVTTYLTPLKSNGTIIGWRVAATCGDYGFGFYHISKRNTIGVRGKKQIFKQIIEKYMLY